MSKCLGQYELIGAEARRLWEKAGCPKDKDLHFWLKAEEILMNGEKWRYLPLNAEGRLWSELNRDERQEINSAIGGSTVFPSLIVEQCKWKKVEDELR